MTWTAPLVKTAHGSLRRQGDRLAFDELAMTTDHVVARMHQELNEPVPIEDPIISLAVGLVLVGHATGSHLGGNLHKPQRATVQAARARRVCRLGAKTIGEVAKFGLS